MDFHGVNKPKYIMGLLGTGIWPLFFAGLRFALIMQYLDSGNENTSPQSMVAIASQLEMAFLLITVNFPAFRVLWRKAKRSPRLKRTLVRPIRHFFRRGPRGGKKGDSVKLDNFPSACPSENTVDSTKGLAESSSRPRNGGERRIIHHRNGSMSPMTDLDTQPAPYSAI
jgi:hypothetical protein